MKNLLRLLLFIFARTGLFLAVVAWIVGQWWAVSVRSPTEPTAFIQIVPDGVVAGLVASMMSDMIIVEPVGDGELLSALFAQEAYQQLDEQPDTFAVLMPPGVSPFYQIGAGAYIALRHWIAVALFLMLNCILWLIYRKRPGAQPCEV